MGGRRELREGEALEIGAPRLARDHDGLARVALDRGEVALPPADAAQEREHLVPCVSGRVGEQVVRLLAEPAGGRHVGVQVQDDLRQLGEREALDRALAGLLRERADVLHLDRRGRELPEPPRGARGMEPPLQAGLELDRAEQQPTRGAVRLACQRATACALEHVRRLGPQVGGHLPLELREERRGTLEVIGLRLDELVHRPRAEPRGERPVEPCPLSLREAAVRDVADQHVAEAERDLARDGGERLAREQLAVDEIGERGVDVERRIQLGDRPAPEHAADEGAVTHDRPRRGRQPVDPRRDQRLHRVRDPHRGGPVALLGEHPDRLLDEERVALRLVEQRGANAVAATTCPRRARRRGPRCRPRAAGRGRS